MASTGGLVGARRGEDGRLVDAGQGDLGEDGLELGRIAARAAAVDDRVDRAQDAEQRPAAAPIVRGAADQARDLDQLDEHAADPGQRRHRPERGERVVAGLDLDLGQRLEQRRLADVGRPDERDLRRALAPDGDRIAVDGARADAGVLDLGQQPLAQVRVWPVLVVRQLGQERVDLADPLPSLLARQSSLRHLGERAMRHRHRHLLRSGGSTARATTAAVAARVRPAPSSDA